MFTGIIEEIGEVEGIKRNSLSVRAELILSDAKQGDSISVNGVCLTVVKISGPILQFELLENTYNITAVKELRRGDRVNLERAVRADGRFGGHLVTGHIDGVGKIVSIVKEAEFRSMVVRIPADIMDYAVPKGSMALDGVSLTIGRIAGKDITFFLIPQTLKSTVLGIKRVGQKVNLEADIIGKYVRKILPDGLSLRGTKCRNNLVGLTDGIASLCSQ